MGKKSEWENDKKRVARLLAATHGGYDMTHHEYQIVMNYWKGKTSLKEVFDQLFARYCDEED